MKMKKSDKSRLITYIMVIAAFAVTYTLIQFGLLSRHVQSMLVPICINIILAVSLNLTVGFLGELTLGHAGFMSVGAYAGSLFSLATKEILPAALRFPAAMLVGGIVACVFGLIIGIPVLRLRGDYLAIVTLAFGEIIRSIIINLEFTGGASGLKKTPQDSNFIAAFIVVMVTLFIIQNLVSSRHGRAIMAIRDNRIAAEASGINVTYYRLLAFVVAAFFAGVAGVLYGHNLSVLKADVFDYNKSIEILVIVVLGGMGSIRGSIIAAVLVTVLPEALRSLSTYRMLIYSIVLIVMMLFNASPTLSPVKTAMAEFFKNPIKKLSGKKEGKV